MPSRSLALATLVALSGSLGCSLVFVDRPPPNHASLRYFDCTSGHLAPVADATLAGLLALATIGTTGDHSSNGGATIEASVLTAGALASAVYGFIGVGHCRDAKEALRARLFLEPEPRPPLPFAPVPPGPAPFASRPAQDPWLSAGPPPEAVAPPPADGAAGVPDGGAR